MLQFSANLSLLYNEYPLPQRFAAAKAGGFDAVEIQFPYSQSAAELRQLLDGNGLRLVLFNVDADTLLQGGEGLAAVPEKRQDFRRAVDQALRYAELLQPCAINVLPGRCLNADRLAEYRATFLENLDYAARAFAGQGIVTVFEAVNSFDMPGFILDSSAQMLQVLHDLNHPHLRLQYDIYHMSRMGEDCAEFLRCHIDRIGHIQFADCPGRAQPGSGSVDFPVLFQIIRDSAYSGWTGAEYRPGAATADSLAWLKSYAASGSGTV
ncbi:hydroxypyruvate isomerase family protein [Methylomonas koyamae]|uniref:Hydroxypyruvate isomerase n=1 Tax=Methylomonas koyamae TaxID=702114 RepID=A0A291ILC1_9GAMM|nr:TIM barrel protein [Methylomonas koyamae]ATG91175.1 hydroxypyruvate isomerase [Methylomonas koyamae]OAI29313.1 hydroxypyruvate isomerase [Methylomonas koyamae]